MEYSWLQKVGNIADYISSKDSSTSASFKRSWQDFDDEDGEYTLADSLVTMAPTGDFVVISKRTKFSSSLTKNGKEHIFRLRTTVDLTGTLNSPQDAPTSVICLPVASQKVSTNGQAEWTCIAVGFKSGLLQMFTENGIYLFGQVYHNKPVVQLKCRTQHWLNTQCGSVAEPGDDFSVLFSDGVLVTIDGFGLFQLLRVVYAQQSLRPSSMSSNNQMPQNMLTFTKWKFSEVDNVNDFVTCGIRPMSELSTLFFSTFQNGTDILSCNQLSHFVSAGSMPFIGTWAGQERRQTGSLISDVTTAVTNKIVSSFTGLLSWSRQTDQQKYSSTSSEEVSPAAELPKSLNLKNTIIDRPRIGQCIAASPNHRLAAVTDNFNRVYVLDLELGIIIKQLKGYRGAQIGWVRSAQENDLSSKYSESRNMRATQFLVIYSPKRSQVEIWGGERWERVHVADVPINSRLIYTPHGMLGWTRSLVNDPMDSGLGSCFLLCSDGPIYNVQIAFHWAVADRNRAKLQDQAVLRDLDSMLKSGKTPSYVEIISKMQLDESRDNLVQLLIRNLQKTPIQLISVLTELLPLSKRLSAEEGQRFYNLCSKAIAAVNFFVKLENFTSGSQMVKPLDSSAMAAGISGRPGVNLEAILSTFSLRGSERDSYKQIFETYCLVNGMKIEGDQNQSVLPKPMKMLEFLELLGLLTMPGISQQSSDILLGRYIFGSLFHMTDFASNSHHFDSAISLFACQLFKPIELLRFLLSFYFSTLSPWLTVEHISLLVSLFQMLSRLNDSVSVLTEFWALCHKMCADSFAHAKALTVALIASQVSTKSQPAASQEQQSSLLELTGDWGDSDIPVDLLLAADIGQSPRESSDNEEWARLCTQLTVLSLFEMLVSCKPQASGGGGGNEDTTETDGWDTDVQDISLFSMPQLSSAMVTENGVDLLCEHICRWIVVSKFDIQSFFARVNITEHNKADFSSKGLLTVDSTMDHLLARLIGILPLSLNSDNIYAGCSWDSAISWSRQDVVGTQPFLLESAINYANLIDRNFRLKCWLFQHIWAQLMRPIIQKIFDVMLQLDRAPRDTELGDGITELSAEHVSESMTKIFEMLMKSSDKFNETNDDDGNDYDNNKQKPNQRVVENVWPPPAHDKARVSLAQQAATADVKLNNKACLNLHLQASIVLRTILHFRMRPVSLDHLFSHIEQSILFHDLFSAPTPPPHVLDYVTESRTTFIVRITKCILMAVKPTTLKFLLTSCPYYDEWNALSMQLLERWHLDKSLIKGKQMAMFCYVGVSQELVEMTEKIATDDDFNAVRFWPPVIAAIGNNIARLVYQGDLARSQQLRNRLDAYAPELVHWLAGCLNEQDHAALTFVSPSQSASTKALPCVNQLLSLSLAQLPETYPFYAMILALCELVGTLQEESSM